MTGTPFLDLRGIGKRFPAVVANDDVSLSVAPGSIHALLGENGAGKSTLVKMIYGVLKPDSGEMRIEGAPYAPERPGDARAAGIGMVFQHFSLFEAMSVVENIALALPREEAGADLSDRIRDVSTIYGLQVDPTRRIDELSAGEKQRVEIVRCLLQSPRLIIMDEPTSVLTPQEASRLFEVLEKLRGEGRSVLYISHKLDEIRRLCDGATVLRRGKVVAVCDPREESRQSLAAMMIGSELAESTRTPASTTETRLLVEGLTQRAASDFGITLNSVRFQVRAGEVLGIAGVAGNGQAELMAALTGEIPCDPAMIRLTDKPVGHLGPVRRRRLGMAFVPEDRLGHGAVATLSLAENALISARQRPGVIRRGFIRLFQSAHYAAEVIDRFRVVASGPDAAAGSLSGGNLQKFIVGREVLQEPSVLIVAQPTWGVDAGSAADIHTALAELAARGTAILVISQDLDELRQISDRLAVLYMGRLSDAYAAADLSVEQIGLMMAGDLNAAEEVMV